MYLICLLDSLSPDLGREILDGHAHETLNGDSFCELALQPPWEASFCWNAVLITGPYFTPIQLEESRTVFTLTPDSSQGSIHRGRKWGAPGLEAGQTNYPTAPWLHIHTKQNGSTQAYTCLHINWQDSFALLYPSLFSSFWPSFPPWAMFLISPFILIIIMLPLLPCIINIFQKSLQEHMTTIFPAIMQDKPKTALQSIQSRV